jgi:hypothetical protein
MNLADHPIQGLCKMLSASALSDVGHRWEAERTLQRQNPKLAALLRAEAIAGGRAECHVAEAAKLPAIRDLLIAVIEAETGKPFRNPLFP